MARTVILKNTVALWRWSTMSSRPERLCDSMPTPASAATAQNVEVDSCRKRYRSNSFIDAGELTRGAERHLYTPPGGCYNRRPI
jgi:hypothetical protein